MPLTETGKEILEIFQEEYGKSKGKRIFYARINKFPKQTKSWHKK